VVVGPAEQRVRSHVREQKRIRGLTVRKNDHSARSASPFERASILRFFDRLP